MSLLAVAPVRLARGADAIPEALAYLAALGPRVLVVRGEVGFDRLGPDTLRHAGIDATIARHTGPCTVAAAAALAATADGIRAHAVLAVGGGRVIDTAKAAADDAGLPFAAIPTSPATCAAVAPVAVTYDASGAFVLTRPVARPPEVVALDAALLAGAPDRLLVAGIVDAIAKVHEVRHTTRAAGRCAATATAALALCDDLEALLDEHAAAAVAAGPDDGEGAGREARRLVAEACVLAPGLIGGLAGEEAKLAAAHPLHNGLTALPASHASLHGELVGFGVLVQIALAGGSEAEVRAEAGRYAHLGLACHLAALGCGEVLDGAGPRLAADVAAMEPIRQSFPEVDAEGLLATIRRVDAWAREEAGAARP